MDLVRFQCPSCGAELPPRAPDAEVICQYCNSHFKPTDARSAKTVAGVVLNQAALLKHIRHAQTELSQAREEAEELREERDEALGELRERVESKRTPGLLDRALTGLLKLALTTFVITFVMAVVLLVLISEGLLSLDMVPVLRDISPLRTLVDEVVDDRFDRQGGPPVIVEIDGQPAALIRVRRAGSELLFIAAFRLPSGEKLWQIGPISTGDGQDLAAIRFASAGPFVVFSDGSGGLHVHDLETSNSMRSLDPRRPIDGLCAPIEGKGGPRIHVLRNDGKHRILDPDTAKLERVSRAPKGCESYRSDSLDPSLVAPDRVRDKLGEFEPSRVHLVGDRAVAVGHDQAEPALALPRVLAVAHEGSHKVRVTLREPLWSVAAAGEHPPEQVAAASSQVSTIAGEHLIVDWREQGGALHLSAFAIADGARVWDVVLEPGGGVTPTLHADARFLLVARDALVEVRDPSNGELLGILTPPG